MMNRNQLALFHTVAREGSISRAAAAAHISQPAVSKQIAELELALGVRLLDRLPRGCRLTDAGRLLAQYAERWRAIEDEAARAIEEFRGLKGGRLAVGASLTIGGYLLPAVIAQFHRRFPGIELRLEIANTERIRAFLLEGKIDIGLTEGPLESEALDSAVFFQDELVAVAPAGHGLLKRQNVTVRELCREPLLIREKGSGTRAAVERALRRHGIKLEPLLSLASPEAIKQAVAAGMGVSILSRLIVELELRAGILGVVRLRDLSIRRALHCQRLRGRQLSPAAMRFLEVLQSPKHRVAPASTPRSR